MHSTLDTRPLTSSLEIRSLEDIRQLEQVPLEQSLEARSTYALLANAAAAFGDKTAISFLRDGDIGGAPLDMSYRQLLAGLHRTANLLHRLAVEPDDAVAILLPACPQYHLALWGGAAAGIVQPLNPLLHETKLASLMNAAKAKVLIAWGADAEAGYWSKALRLRALVPSLTTVLRVQPIGESAPWDLIPGVQDFDEALQVSNDRHLDSGREIAPEDIAAYFHTGGTTGDPKLARHSHRAQVFTAWACVQMQGLASTDVLINGYPLFHVGGVLTTSLPLLAAGGHLVIPGTTLMRNREVVRQYWQLQSRFKATLMSAAPTMLAALAEIPLEGADLSAIRYCRTGTAPLSAELATRIENHCGVHAHECLGMTEMAGISTIMPPGVHGPAGCVGFPVPFARMRIVAMKDESECSNIEVPPGTSGAILFHSPNLFSGYLNPSDNAGAFTSDGWLNTGDIGWQDEKGRLHISGRSKDLIIRGGHNIDPKTIEETLSRHPAVQFAAAVGAPDEYAGEIPVVFVSLRDGAHAEESELLSFALQNVEEGPARPRAVKILDTLPTTTVGKIFKPELRQHAAIDVVRARLALLEFDRPSEPQLHFDSSGRLIVVLDDAPKPGLKSATEVLARLGLKGEVRIAPNQPLTRP